MSFVLKKNEVKTKAYYVYYIFITNYKLEFKMERITIFIDNSNIFKGFQKYNIQADYEKLKTVITRGRKLDAIYLYEGVVYPMSPEKKRWYEQLSARSGYIIEASFEDAYDTAVLVSGDGDFLPVVKKVKELDKNVELWAFKYSLANTLREQLGEDRVVYLDDILHEITL